MAEPFVGQICAFGFNFAPRGFALCDGQLLAISSNTALFSLLGTMYGGDGRDTFALPDLRGRTPIHMGTGPGLSNRREGSRGGSEFTSLNITNMPSHNHSVSQSISASTKVFAEAATTDDPTDKYFGKPDSNIYIGSGRTAKSMADDAITINAQIGIVNNGGSQPHNNMQPYLTINYSIALFGTFPSRS
jgi:microcystin-dependent protein